MGWISLESRRHWTISERLGWNKLELNMNFSLHVKPSRGRYGGIFLGIKSINFKVNNVEGGDHFIRLEVSNRDDGFKRNLITIYGPS